MRFNIYSVWMEPSFYIAAVVFAFALFFLVFSIRKCLEIRHKSAFEKEDEDAGELRAGPASNMTARVRRHPGEEDEAGEVQGELPLTEAAPDEPEARPFGPETEANDPVSAQIGGGHATKGLGGPAPAVDASPSALHSRAEEFVKGLYDQLASLNGRVKNIETDLTKSRVNRDFATKFLEDMVSDFDSLDKAKIKARIEYLLSDLRK